MKILYIKGKKFFEYFHTKPIIFGRFLDQYTVNEEEYRRIKRLSLSKKQRRTHAKIFEEQRDSLFYLIYKEFVGNQANIIRLAKKYGYHISKARLCEILTEKKAKESLFKKESEVEMKEGVKSEKTAV